MAFGFDVTGYGYFEALISIDAGAPQIAIVLPGKKQDKPCRQLVKMDEVTRQDKLAD